MTSRPCGCDCRAPFDRCPCRAGECGCDRLDCRPCMAARADGGRSLAAHSASALIGEATSLLVEAERVVEQADQPATEHVEALAHAVTYLTKLRIAINHPPVNSQGKKAS